MSAAGNRATRLAMRALLLLPLLAACSERPQTADATTRKSDQQAWAGTQGSHTASGWQPGDQAAWEQQLRARAQAQNDYARAPAQP